MDCRRQIEAYIREKYHGEIEYPWMRFPTHGVFRHQDNQKTYGVLMDIPRARLHFPGEGHASILNLKMNDPLLRDFLLQREGFYPGQNTCKGNWIAVMLDGTVSVDEIAGLIDTSFLATASAAVKKALRPPKEWIIPANPKYYDVETAFAQADEIDWKQGAGIKDGDTVYLYVAVPVSAVRYKCLVTKTNIPFHYEVEGVHIRELMRIRLAKTYAPDKFTFEKLGSEYGIYTVRGPRGIPRNLSKALNAE